MSLISASRCLPAAWIFCRSGMKALMPEVLGLLLEHLAVADDGVQRRAQFVAHVGEEGALGPVRGLGCDPRLVQFFRRRRPFDDPREDIRGRAQEGLFGGASGVTGVDIDAQHPEQFFSRQKGDAIMAVVGHVNGPVLMGFIDRIAIVYGPAGRGPAAEAMSERDAAARRAQLLVKVFLGLQDEGL